MSGCNLKSRVAAFLSAQLFASKPLIETWTPASTYPRRTYRFNGTIGYWVQVDREFLWQSNI